MNHFLLKKDETWTMGLKVATFPDGEKKDYFFRDFDEVYQILGTLTGKAVVDDSLPKDKSEKELMAAAEDMIDRVWKAVMEAREKKLGS